MTYGSNSLQGQPLGVVAACTVLAFQHLKNGTGGMPFMQQVSALQHVNEAGTLGRCGLTCPACRSDTLRMTSRLPLLPPISAGNFKVSALHLQADKLNCEQYAALNLCHRTPSSWCVSCKMPGSISRSTSTSTMVCYMPSTHCHELCFCVEGMYSGFLAKTFERLQQDGEVQYDSMQHWQRRGAPGPQWPLSRGPGCLAF